MDRRASSTRTRARIRVGASFSIAILGIVLALPGSARPAAGTFDPTPGAPDAPLSLHLLPDMVLADSDRDLLTCIVNGPNRTVLGPGESIEQLVLRVPVGLDGPHLLDDVSALTCGGAPVGWTCSIDATDPSWVEIVLEPVSPPLRLAGFETACFDLVGASINEVESLATVLAGALGRDGLQPLDELPVFKLLDGVIRHADLSEVSDDQHHERYEDAEALAAVLAGDGAGSGLDADLLDGMDSTELQRRVAGSCPPGESIREILADGTVTCEPDDDTEDDGDWQQAGDAVYRLDGRVGLGTSTPEGALHVVRDGKAAIRITGDSEGTAAAGSARLILRSDGGAAHGRIILDDPTHDLIITNVNDASVHLSTQNTPRMTVDADGAVGIGTTTPAAPLDVVGTVQATDFACVDCLEADELATNSVGGDEVDATQVQLRIGGDCPPGSSIRSIAADGTVTCEPDDDTGDDGDWQQAGDVVYRLDGRVGLGTSTPEGALHVVRDGKAAIRITGDSEGTAAAGSARLILRSDGGAAHGRIILDDPTHDLIITNVNDASVHLSTQNTPRMTVDADGAVGIGTTTPAAALDVVGTVQATDFACVDCLEADELASNSVGGDEVDATQVQLRIGGDCPPGSSIRSIAADGTVTCEPDDDTGDDGDWQQAGDVVYRLDGRVGLGTSTPEGALHVVRDGKAAIRITGDSEGTAAAGSARLILRSDGGAAHGRIILDDPTHDLIITNVNDASVHLSTQNTPRMTVAADGAVGIGTSTPAAALDVVGTVQATDFDCADCLEADELATDAVGTDEIASGAVGSDEVDPAQVQLRIGADCPPGSSIRSIAADGTVTCEADDTGAPDDGDWVVSGSHVYRSSGNVGVGTTSPTAELHVSRNGAAVLALDADQDASGDQDASVQLSVDGGNTTAELFLQDSSNDFLIAVDGTHRLRIENDGDIKVSGAASPVRFFTYRNLGSSVDFDTGISTNSRSCAVAGFDTETFNYQESTGGAIRVFAYPGGGTWHVKAEVHSHGNHEDFKVSLICFANELVSSNSSHFNSTD